MTAKGVAVLVPGDDLDTDVMYPGACLNIEEPAEMAPHLFEGYDPCLLERLGNESILVVGKNFGIGSSREHVPQAMQANGVQGIVGQSFARIFFRNCINLGLAVSACPEAVAAAREGSHIVIASAGTVEVDGVRYSTPPLAVLLREIIHTGGLVDWTAQRLVT